MNTPLQPNFTQIPNVVLDEWLPQLSGSACKVVLFVASRTYGWQKPSGDAISVAQIVTGTGLRYSTVVAVCQELKGKGVLLIAAPDATSGHHDARNIYRLNLDAETPNEH